MSSGQTTKTGSMRRRTGCIFCPGQRATREHVWADWIEAILPGAGDFTFTSASDAPGAESRSWPQRRLDLTVRRVCGDCNNGWMSALESGIKPLLTQLVQGRPVMLSPLDQERVAIWTYKTALVLALTNQSGDRYFTDDDYSAFKRDPTPPPGTRIWLSAYNGPRQWTSWYRKKVVVLTRESTGETRDGHVMVATLGRLVLVQFCSRWGELVRWLMSPSYDRFLVPVWPPGAIATWPPAGVLDDDGLNQLVQRFSGGPAAPA